jgi:hypothetical protein
MLPLHASIWSAADRAHFEVKNGSMSSALSWGWTRIAAIADVAGEGRITGAHGHMLGGMQIQLKANSG